MSTDKQMYQSELSSRSAAAKKARKALRIGRGVRVTLEMLRKYV
jgi:hypothetical protein